MGLLRKLGLKKKKKDVATTVTTMGCTQSKGAADGIVSSHGASPPTARSVPVPVTQKEAAKSKLPNGKKVDAKKDDSNDSNNNAAATATSDGARRYSSYESGGSTPDFHSDDDNETSSASSNSRSNHLHKNKLKNGNPKSLSHSTSAIGLDEMIEDRRCDGDLRQNVVHIEVPFGKPIEEVYEGVHSGPVLGSGISGLVRLVTHKATGIKYAVKVLDLGLVDTSEGLTQLREEIFIMCQLDHPNIVRLEEVYESQSEIYLVQELCLGGELFDRLDEQPDYHYTEAECARLVKQMLSAVRYLHSKGIIHRDLKLENFLFSSTSKDSELKMIDFGLSKHFSYGEVQHEAVGTPYTVAPEVIRGTYDERCDVWAIGVISFLLLSGDPPFGGCGGPEPLMTVRSNILRGSFRFEPEEIWSTVSSLARNFIKDMLRTDPKDRPTARKAQHHQWLQEWADRSRKGKDNQLNPNVVKALVNFKELSDMRKLLCEVLSFTLLPYQIKELRREFEKMDTEGSGEISLAALKQVLVSNAGAGSLGALTEEEVEDIFNAMRVRKTETRIHWHEFIAAGLSQCQVDDRNLRLAFDRLDSDHKGYIILDDIMDLMGSDALQQSEDDMQRMWGDSVKAVQGKNARITYDDFLLLMKGQTKDLPVPPTELVSSSLVRAPRLLPVSEISAYFDEASAKTDQPGVIVLASGDVVTLDGKIAVVETINDLMPRHSPLTAQKALQSAPNTPVDRKRLLDEEMGIDSPLSMDDDDDLVQASGPGVPGSSASLTPPMSPTRSVQDYVTPSGARRTFCDLKDLKANLHLPGFPSSTGKLVATPLPLYTRRRSRSMGDEDSPSPEKPKETDESRKLTAVAEVAEVVREMILPETDRVHPINRNLGDTLSDGSKTALVVNRKLYRAHRQMRLAVLDASKRFEEQQAEHAKELILAAREEDDLQQNGMIQAGLVMRHGHKKQVSSQAIRTLLDSNRMQQQALVEKANKRGGRGRRSRKKTFSDMSGMLASMGSEDLSSTIARTSTEEMDQNITIPLSCQDMVPLSKDAMLTPLHEDSELLPSPLDVSSEDIDLTASQLKEQDGHLRSATVPGEFRKTSDPFSKVGRYGALPAWKEQI